VLHVELCGEILVGELGRPQQALHVVHVLVGRDVEIERPAVEDPQDVFEDRGENLVFAAFRRGRVAHVDQDVPGQWIARFVLVRYRDEHAVAEAHVVETND
jgi:hypothetical protein